MLGASLGHGGTAGGIGRHRRPRIAGGGERPGKDEAAVGPGGHFSFGGRVIHGDHRGRKLGFPTANLAIGSHRAMLPNGAYAVLIWLNGKRYNGIANIGDNPTFEGCNRRLEVNILDFSQNIYDAAITVQFVGKLREQKKFSGVDALVKQLRADEITARKLLADKVK